MHFIKHKCLHFQNAYYCCCYNFLFNSNNKNQGKMLSMYYSSGLLSFLSAQRIESVKMFVTNHLCLSLFAWHVKS